MIIFLDTEFTRLPDEKEYLPPPELVSIALAAEDGQEFYAETTGWRACDCSLFVKSDVLPHLSGHRLPLAELKVAIGEFLSCLGPAQVATDYDGDWRYLLALLDGKLPANINPNYLFVSSICEGFVYEREDDRLPDELPRHHALADARALRRQWLAWRDAHGGSA